MKCHKTKIWHVIKSVINLAMNHKGCGQSTELIMTFKEYIFIHGQKS